MNIAIDTREQTPYTFSGYPVEVVRGTLSTGDYSVPGFEDAVAIERKELGDLLGCLTHDRERFMRELERLRGHQSAALLVEAPLSRIRSGKYRSHISPEAAEQSLISLMERYRLPVYFAEDRADGERFIYDFLRHFLRHTKERFNALKRACNHSADGV